jgi:UDP-N-acetylmuramoyl-L-alanyl-D-glutamate--2,6-diaminopimelate ligase
MKGLEFDSRKVKPGDTYVAIRGQNFDGYDFIKEAIEKGAAEIVSEKDLPSGTWKLPKGVKYTKVADSRQALGELASKFYGEPSKKLKLIGVTGTKGKTTTCHIIHHILTKLGKKAGIITSVTMGGYHITSPDVITFHRLLKEMVDDGCEYGIIEVSSHAIDQKRIAGAIFDLTVLTNIAPEHLDYHKTFEMYRKIKMSFLNSGKIKIISPKTTTLDILPGIFNNINAETAVDAVEKLGFKRHDALKALQSFELPQGRLEKMENGRGIDIYIDFAHTPDSLKEALTYLKENTKGRLISVFGCAGERDTKKRTKMGRISSEIADISVFTAEDPRHESIHDILRSMKKGVKDSTEYICIPERGEAIVHALSIAKNGDCVALLGKGHEKSQSYEGHEHPWSDQEKVKNFLDSNSDISAVILAAGKGSRMKSYLPKVLKKICGKPMISYTLENLRKVGINDITVVVSYRKNLVIKEIGGAVKFAYQKNPKGGTADAAKAGLENIGPKSKTLVVIYGDDSAFYKAETIKNVLKIHEERERKLTFVSLMKNDPTGLGRVIRGKNGLITNIVEEKDATEAERKIKEVNDGLYVFDRDWFAKNINKVKKGPQGEYYLVDIVKMAIDQGDRMATYTLPNDDEWQGVNTPEQLDEANKKMAKRLILK